MSDRPLARSAPSEPLPDDVRVDVVRARGGDGFMVRLDVEGQVSELHPHDALAIARALDAAAGDATVRSEG